MQVIENWKTRPDGKHIKITNPAMVSGKVIWLRQNETGRIMSNAHDVQEDCPYTYTEICQDDDPRKIAGWNRNNPYSKGELVQYVSNFMGPTKYKIFISDEDNNLGNDPRNGLNWSEYWPLPTLPGPEPGWHDYIPETDGADTFGASTNDADT